MTGWRLPPIPLRAPRRARKGAAAPLPTLWFDPKAVRRLRREWPLLEARIAEGRRLFLLEVASVLRDEVLRADPAARVAGSAVRYARSLRVGVLREAADEVQVGIWAGADRRTLTAMDLAGTLLYVTRLPKGAAPWWRVVARHSPWPAAMLPARPPPGAQVVARRGRPDELRTRAQDLEAADVGAELRAAGGPGMAGGLELWQHAEGIVVHDDLAHAALRAEWGFDGTAEQAAWRPAIRAALAFVPLALRHWRRYLETGHPGSFPYLRDADAQPTTKVDRDGRWFQHQLAPFVASIKPGGGTT